MEKGGLTISGKMSRNKGKRGEREFAKKLGYNARRGIQFRGGEDSPDVVSDLEEFHFEVKRTERLSLWDALAQASRDSGNKIPIVAHRKNHKPWVIILTLDDFKRIIKQNGYRDFKAENIKGLD